MDSMDETLDYFSEEGVPLRAAVSLSLSRDDIVFAFGKPGQAGKNPLAIGAGSGATTPLKAAQPVDNVQQLAGRNGKSSNWKAIATANNIDDPLRLPAGTLLNLNIAS